MAKTARIWLALAGVDGFMAVAFGGFAAHAIKDPATQAVLHTGSQYQAVHAAAALACFSLMRGVKGPAYWAPAYWAAALFALGGFIFGGSLYVLGLSGVKLWGAVTPIGGLLLLTGWAVLTWGALSGRLSVEH